MLSGYRGLSPQKSPEIPQSRSRAEIYSELNESDKLILSIVMVDGDQHEGPLYVREAFGQEPDWAVTSIDLDLDQLLARATPAA